MPNDSGAPAAQTEVTGTALLTLDPVQYVTAVFATFRERLDAAKAAAAAVTVVDTTTPDGMKTAIMHRAAFRAIRVEAEKARALRKKPILDIGRLLDTRAKELEAEITPLEDRFDTAIKAEEQRKEAEKAARDRAEAERIAKIQTGIRAIRGVIIDVAGRSSADIEAAIRNLVAEDITRETAQEFLEEAETTREQTLGKLREMLEVQQRAEAEAAQIKAERAELERRQAEQAERERVEQEQRAAADRQRKEDDAARQRAFEAQQAAMSELNGIHQQVIIAQIGRLGVRVGGTIECIRDTLAETEAWPIDAERFGGLTASAQQAKDAAVAQIRALLDAAIAKEAEAARLREAEERLAADARALEDRQRQERQAQEDRERAEREAAEARERDERLAREQLEREEREARELAERQERERIEAEQRQRETAARETRERAEAEERERVRVELERTDIREALKLLRVRAGGIDEFAWFAKAFDAHHAPKVARKAKAAA